MKLYDIKAEDAPCPAIIYDEGRVKCGFVLAERAVLKTDVIATALGIDTYCDSTDIKDRQ